MRLRIRHKISTRFDGPARNVTRILRLTPRSHEGQHVIGWRLDVDTDCVLKQGEDGFGNLTHTFTAKGPCEEMTISVAGEIDNFDAAGVVRGSAERLPIELYHRETSLTLADTALRHFARDSTADATGELSRLHALMGAVHGEIVFDGALPDAGSCASAFASKKGNGRDIAHIYTACARAIGFPARVTSGYYLCETTQRGLSHAWSEVLVPGLGWTGFDAAHDICPQESHVRLATGLDALAAAPVRGVGGEVAADVLDVTAPYGRGWGQSQTQGLGGQSQSQGGPSQGQDVGGQMQSQGGQSQRQR